MPSRYEPCGLNQLYSLKYGTVLVVHATGGLADSITNLTAGDAAARGARRNGFSFNQYTPNALAGSAGPSLPGLRESVGVGAVDPHRHDAELVVGTQCPRVQPAVRNDRCPADANCA